LRKRASTRQVIGNFPIIEAATTIGTTVYAVKAFDSTWHRQASQEFYRSEAEWSDMEPIFGRFAEYQPHEPLLRSTSTGPIVMPGGDDFEYIDALGDLITHSNRDKYAKQLRGDILRCLRQMDSMNVTWGILEIDQLFSDLVAESDEARAIVSKGNVILFDPRMQSQPLEINGVKKEIYPAAAALMLDIPILILSEEPQIDVLWKRASRYFRHKNLYASCHTLMKFFDAGILMSPSLENGEYNRSPSETLSKVQDLLARFSDTQPSAITAMTASFFKRLRWRA
jgi:hypothetical protein